MKVLKCLSLTILLSAITSVVLPAQTMVLQPKTNRWLINERTSKPRLDVIVQQFTDREKYEISKIALIDTLTKPTFLSAAPFVYRVTAGRMAENMMLVIRDADALPPGYYLEFDEKRKDWNQRPQFLTQYSLEGEIALPTFPLPFGPDSVRVSLKSSEGDVISEILFRLTYPTPELFSVDLGSLTAGDETDTIKLRENLEFFNKVPNRYSRHNGVPDSLVVGENNINFGFLPAYYDGQIQGSQVHYTIHYSRENNRHLMRNLRTDFSRHPFILIDHMTGNGILNWLVDGTYVVEYSYSESRKNTLTYQFHIDHSWVESLLNNIKVLFIFSVLMLTLSNPWLLLLVLSGIGFLIYRRRVKKAQLLARKTSLEIQAIQSQLNPHFVFNALGSLQGLINTNENQKANQYLVQFSKLLRTTLHNSNREMVPLSSEIEAIENYVRLEQTRFGFQYRIETDTRLSIGTIEVPTLLIQPLVENAIKHGISGLTTSGQLHIRFILQANDLVAVVKDNGEGYDTARSLPGKGLSLTNERIKLLNKTHPPIRLNIVSDEHGTEARVTFQNWIV